MNTEELKKLIESLESLQRAAQRAAALADGEPVGSDAGAWWLRGTEDE